MTRLKFFLAILLGRLINWYSSKRQPINQDDCDNYNDTEGRPPEDRE